MLNKLSQKKLSEAWKKRLTDNMGLVLVSSDNKEVTKNAENKEETTEEPTER